MPIYEYRCKQCDAQFDVLQRVGEDGKDLVCPECGAKSAERLMSLFASSGNDSGGSGGCSPRAGFT